MNMKKNITTTVFILLILSVRLFAQNNLTWIINEKVENGYFKNKLEIKSSFSGFTNAIEAAAFFNKIKTNPEILSVEPLGKDEKGNYSVMFKVKEVHNAKFYLNMFNKTGVSYVEINGRKKGIPETLSGIENKHTEAAHQH
jgi:hypothetical protein